MISGLISTVLLAATGASGASVPMVHVDSQTKAFMSCVSYRESRGIPTAVSHTGNHRGKYQVTDAMRVGMSWNILPWLRTWHPNPNKYSLVLRRTPMNKWPERVQDAAFVLTLHHTTRWAEWQHWYLAGSRCNRLVP